MYPLSLQFYYFGWFRLCLVPVKYFPENKYFPKMLFSGKENIFQVFGCIMKIVVENIFMCLVLFWKCYFPTNFLHFLSYFLSIQTNFITKKFQNHSQIPIHRTNHSQIPTPHTIETPIQPTVANSDNQKPQPPKHHYHTTTTTTKIKITERERSVGRRRDRAEARSSGAVLRSTRPVRSGACNRRTGARGSPATSKAWFGLPLLSLSLSLSLSPETIWSENRNGNEFQWSKLLFYGQMKMISEKFYFQNQPNSLFYRKWFPESVYHQNKRTLS